MKIDNSWEQPRSQRTGKRFFCTCWLCGYNREANEYRTKMNNLVSPCCDNCKEIINIVESADGYVDYVSVDNFALDFSSDNTKLLVNGKEQFVDAFAFEFEFAGFTIPFWRVETIFLSETQTDRYGHESGLRLFGHMASQYDYTQLSVKELADRIGRESVKFLGESEIIEFRIENDDPKADSTYCQQKEERFEMRNGHVAVVVHQRTERDYSIARREIINYRSEKSEWEVYSVYQEIDQKVNNNGQ